MIVELYIVAKDYQKQLGDYFNFLLFTSSSYSTYSSLP